MGFGNRSGTLKILAAIVFITQSIKNTLQFYSHSVILWQLCFISAYSGTDAQLILSRYAMK